MPMPERMTKRRLLARALGGLAAGALTACGPVAGGPSTGKTATKQPVTLTFESYASGPAAAGQISEFENWKQAFVRVQQKHPHVTVEATFIGGMNPGSYDRWTIAMTADTAPSIMEFETKRMSSFADKGLLLDLTTYAAKSRTARKADFLEADWEKTIYKGKMWLLVGMSKPAVIFYNTELLKRIGVNSLTTKWGDPAWTWDAFVQLCRKLTTGTGPSATYGYDQSRWWVYLQPFVWSNGGDFLNKDRTAGAIDQPEAVEALQRVQDLGLKDKAMPLPPNAPEGNPNLQTGRVAMYQTNSGGWETYARVPDLKWNIAPIPTGKRGTIARNPPNGWSSWSGNKHPDESWLVMEELAMPDSLRTIQGVPARKAQTESGDFASAKVPGLDWQVFVDAKKSSRDEPVTQYFQDLDKTIRTMENPFWRGEISVKELTAQTKRKIDAVQRGEGPQT